MIDARDIAVATTLLVLTMGLSSQAANAEPGERDGRRGPPQEAFDACTGMVEGDACGFSGHRGDVEGSCIVPPRGEESLVCAPADREHKRKRRDEKTEDEDTA